VSCSALHCSGFKSAKLTPAASAAAHQAKGVVLQCAKADGHACNDADALFMHILHLDDELGSGTLERHGLRSTGSRPAMAVLHTRCLSVCTTPTGRLHLNEGARLQH
jgi:hypothetical protein